MKVQDLFEEDFFKKNPHIDQYSKKNIEARIRQIMYDRRLSGEKSNNGELQMLRNKLKEIQKKNVNENVSSFGDRKAKRDRLAKIDREQNDFRQNVKSTVRQAVRTRKIPADLIIEALLNWMTPQDVSAALEQADLKDYL